MSIKGRLTLWFTCLFGVIVVALAFGSYSLVRRQAYSKLNISLRVAMGATAMSAEHEFTEHSERAGGESDLQSVLDEAASPDLVDTQILVKDGSRIAAFKAGSSGRDVRTLDTSRVKALTTIDGLRIGSRDLPIAKFQKTYKIYAAKPVATAVAQIAKVRLLLFLLVPIGLAAAGAAGYVLASRALKPLQDFALIVDAVTSSDLSARVRLGSHGDEISTLGLRFNALLERLERAFLLQRRFMADASHQIKTPVTVALAAAQFGLRDTNASANEMRDSLQTVEKQTRQLRRIVEDMFFLSQADTMPLHIERQEVYLDDAVAEAARAALALAREKQQEIRIVSLPEARCLGDVDLLTQAVLVLLDNAVKFTPQGGSITVELGKEGRTWACSVSDTGVGIPEAEQERVFERFFQVSQQDRGQRRGAGLGLAIAKSIVENHGGNLVLVESKPGRTIFKMLVPALEESGELSVAQANSSAVRM